MADIEKPTPDQLVSAASSAAEKAGLSVHPDGIDAAARALATDEGRRSVLKELGVHVSGKLAERYGVEDAEAQKILDESRALRTREGRAKILATYAGEMPEQLQQRVAGRSIVEKREAIERLLANDTMKTGLKRAGKGILIGAVVLIVVLLGVLIGAVALLDSLVSGGEAAADVVTLEVATRPGWAAFVADTASA